MAAREDESDAAACDELGAPLWTGCYRPISFTRPSRFLPTRRLPLPTRATHQLTVAASCPRVLPVAVLFNFCISEFACASQL